MLRALLTQTHNLAALKDGVVGAPRGGFCQPQQAYGPELVGLEPVRASGVGRGVCPETAELKERVENLNKGRVNRHRVQFVCRVNHATG